MLSLALSERCYFVIFLFVVTLLKSYCVLLRFLGTVLGAAPPPYPPHDFMDVGALSLAPHPYCVLSAIAVGPLHRWNDGRYPTRTTTAPARVTST